MVSQFPLLQMIRKATFIEDRETLKAMRLIATMVVYAGSPGYLDELRAVEHRMAMGRNYFQNLMWIQRSRNEENLITFEKDFFVSGYRWPNMPLSVSLRFRLDV